MTPVVVVPRAELRESDTAAVGQQEEAGPLMGRSHVRSANEDGSADVAVALKLGEDGGKSSPCTADVLPEEERGLALVGNADLLKEESGAFSVEPGLLSGNREVLARCAASDAIHDATPRAAVEGAQVVPDRSLRQGLLFHPGHEAGRGEGFPLDVHHSAGDSAGGSLKPEVEPSATAADAENVEGTYSHIHAAPFARIDTFERHATTCDEFSRSAT